MQRTPRTMQSVAACPSCGAVRLRREMRYCDQCGKRIPDSLIQRLGREKVVEPQEEDRLIGPAAAVAETPPPLELSDRADQSLPVPSVSDTSAKSQPDTGLLRKKEARVGAAISLGRQQVLGMFFIAFGVLTALASSLIGAANLGGLGLASFLIGLLLLYVRSQPSFSPELVTASMLSNLTNIERVLRDLGPETKALYLKVHDRRDVPMVFLPLDENPSPPSGLELSDEDRFLLIDSGDPHKTGLLLEAPGASLLALTEKESGVDFMDLNRQDFLDPLRSGMVESLGVAADVKATVTEEGVRFRIRDGALGGLSRSVARSAPNVASRLGCPVCSAAICATVKAAKIDIILEEAVHQSGFHTVTLRFAGGPTDGAS